ncbi:MAG TPA: BatA domain-containing protein, partial [Planctomycetota bacterium]|nr:BatA domain-containing protein [Planctomycetota bacterium]
MSFLHPAAFWGLVSLLVLILLSLWRQRAARVVVPSLRLWRMIPDRLPPVRSLRRPRASLSLFLQMLVATSLVFALAGPGTVRQKPAPRRIAVVADDSAYMSPRRWDVRRELDKLDPADDLVFIDCTTLQRGLSKYDVVVNGLCDPRPALDLAASEAKTVVFISDRAPPWTPPAGVSFHLVLVGGPLRTVGIVDAGVDNGKLFLRLTAAAEVRVAFDGNARKIPAAKFHLIEVPAEARFIEASVDPDEFQEDDYVVLRRHEGRIDVAFEGRPDASILAAIESNPLARISRGGTPRLLIRIGAASDRSKAPVVVEVDPLEGVESRSEPGAITVAPHELTEGVVAEDLRFTEVGKLAGPVEAPLFFNGGAPVAAVRRPGEIVVAAKYSATGWPARPSFPIFWANVLKYSASGIAAWRATGLLNEAASRPGLERKPLDPGAFGARPSAPVRTDLAGASIALAALFLAACWIV